MSRNQDVVIDDDEETCPLCIEEFDLYDKHFKPCPCGFQICQFCFNTMKTTYEKSNCPNCRRPYDESTIQYKVPTAEELKADQLNKNKKLAATKRKETEKREVEASTRRNLAGVRVKQQNLVYVIGLDPNKKDEATLMETLRGKEYFGQYGPIEKIVVSKPKPGVANQGVGVYVTFRNKEDAALCISAVDGSQNGDRTLRAQYGTTKYCSTYLRGDTCQNKNCSFLHENGEEGYNTSMQNEPIEGKSKPIPMRSQTTPQPHGDSPSISWAPPVTSTAMLRGGSGERASSRQGSHDASALPSSVAPWANAPVTRTRRASQAASASTASPQLTQSAVTSATSKKQEQSVPPEPTSQERPSTISTTVPKTPPAPVTKAAAPPQDPLDLIVRHLKEAISNKSSGFCFDDSSLSDEARAIVAALPPLIDPYGGAKRRVMEDKQAEIHGKLEAEEKQRVEEQAKSAVEEAMDEDNMATGSLALGGEPEDNPRSSSARGAIGRPSQTPSNLPFDQLSLARSLTPQQRQQLALMNAGVRMPQSASHNTAFELSDFDRRAPQQFSQAQYDQMSSHARHGSRYFNNDSKSSANRFPSTQQQQQQQGFFSSGVQGPPPGLPTAGTPSVSGGGMFAHGQGFTSSGFGASKETDNLRARSSTNNTGHDVKRGGVEHLADPSILSARLHQGTTGQGLFGGSQGEFTLTPSTKSFEPRSTLHSRVSSYQSQFQNLFTSRTSTPKVPPGLENAQTGSGRSTPHIPPGFENLHGHPPRTDEAVTKSTPQITTPAIVPVVPAISALPRSRKSSLHESKPISTGIPGNVVFKTKDEVEPSYAPVEIVPKKSVQVHLSSSAKTEPSTKTVPVILESDKESSEVENLDSSTTVSDSATVVTVLKDTADTTTSNVRPSEPAQLQELGISKAANVEEASDEIALPAKQENVLEGKLPRKDAATPKPMVQSSISSKHEIDSPKKTEEVVAHNETESTAKAEVVENSPMPPSQVTSPQPLQPAPKRPVLRTLNITSEMIAQSTAQSAVPVSATTERSAAFPTLAHIRQSSRQPSVSVSTTVSRPSTPAASEQLMSYDVSRANTPPPIGSLVGSAPARQKTKAQQKKERKEKARKATEVSESGSVTAAPTPPIVEDVAPVVARQKKQKKQKASVSTNQVNAKQTQSATDKVEHQTAPEPQNRSVAEAIIPEPVAPKEDEKLVEEQPPAPEAPPPRTPTPPSAEPEIQHEEPLSYTLRDFYNDANTIEAKYEPGDDQEEKRKELHDLLTSHVSSLQMLLSEMISTGDLAKDHPYFMPQSFTSGPYKLPPDNRKGQTYLDGNGYSSSDVFGMVYLPNKEKRALYNGHAVSVADSGDRKDDLLRRCLITPNGAVLRHLSREEGEKVLDLEERRSLYLEEYGELGRMDGLGRLEDDDFVNLEGGFDELSRFGDRHGVCWVVNDTDQAKTNKHQRSISGNGLDDDYGLGDMPVNVNEFDDQYDDADDDEDDEEELEGEEMVLEAEGADEIEYADEKLDYAQNNLNLPPLPDVVDMPGAWDPNFNTSTYPVRVTPHQAAQHHAMYSSIGPSYEGMELPLPPQPPTSAAQAVRNPNTLPPLRHPRTEGVKESALNLRTMTTEQLEKRLKEKAREIENSRKEMEKAEKMLNKKVKDAGRWRESVFKAAVS